MLLIDLSGFANALDSLPYIMEARDIVGTQSHKSVYCLVDVSESRFNVDVVEALKDLAIHNQPFVIASAVIGVTGLKRVILEGVVKVTGRTNLKPLPSREAAFGWLAAQSEQV